MLKESDLVECVKDSLKGYIDNVSCLQAILDGIDQSSINQALANEYASHIAANEQQVEQALEFKARLYHQPGAVCRCSESIGPGCTAGKRQGDPFLVS